MIGGFKMKKRTGDIMPRFMKKISKKTGLPPGTLIHVGEKKTEKVRIRVMAYDEENLEEKDLDTIEECFPYLKKPTITWINIDGLHEVDVIDKIGKHFGLHPLVLEDILHTNQRPKVEDFEDYLFITSKMLSYDDKMNQVHAEQFSLVLGTHYMISFQEEEGDVFNPIRERLRKKTGRIGKMGVDYLAYALMDAIVDNYFVLLEKLGEKIESLEESLISDPGPNTLNAIHHLKRELIFLRKSVWPLREVINSMERLESTLIHDRTSVFLRDVYDHTIQVIEIIETFQDMVSGMLDVYLSSLSNRMNEVMKVLTIIATIFIPLTFIAGVYGMNFKHMPELEWHWGYHIVLSIMAILAIFMLFYFRKKRWL
jgi:magnesium transporter